MPLTDQPTHALHQQDHPTVLEATEIVFTQTIMLATVLSSVLEGLRAGNDETSFRDFRENFHALYFLTSDTSTAFMTDNRGLIMKINEWFTCRNGCTLHEQSRKGIGLFDEYRKALMSSGIITLKR